jgi:hypothetical protein
MFILYTHYRYLSMLFLRLFFNKTFAVCRITKLYFEVFIIFRKKVHKFEKMYRLQSTITSLMITANKPYAFTGGQKWKKD